MKVLFVGSEVTPYIKSGGLADVLGSLPKALVEQGVECSVVLPKYRDMKFADTLEYVTSYYIWVSWRREYCGIFKTELDYLISNNLIIHNNKNLYLSSRGKEIANFVWEKFI